MQGGELCWCSSVEPGGQTKLRPEDCLGVLPVCLLGLDTSPLSGQTMQSTVFCTCGQHPLCLGGGPCHWHPRALTKPCTCSLKSANILLDKDYRAKVADVGLSKTLTQYHNDSLSTYMATSDIGTFSWSAPEVLLGLPCTPKADVYSFGVVRPSCPMLLASAALPKEERHLSGQLLGVALEAVALHLLRRFCCMRHRLLGLPCTSEADVNTFGMVQPRGSNFLKALFRNLALQACPSPKAAPDTHSPARPYPQDHVPDVSTTCLQSTMVRRDLQAETSPRLTTGPPTRMGTLACDLYEATSRHIHQARHPTQCRSCAGAVGAGDLRDPGGQGHAPHPGAGRRAPGAVLPHPAVHAARRRAPARLGRAGHPAGGHAAAHAPPPAGPPAQALVQPSLGHWPGPG